MIEGRVNLIFNAKGIREVEGEKASKPETRPELKFSSGLLNYMPRALYPRMLKATSGRAVINKMHKRAASHNLPTVPARRHIVRVELDVLVSEVDGRALDHRVQEVKLPEVALSGKYFLELEICGKVRAASKSSKVVGCIRLPNVLTEKLRKHLLQHINKKGVAVI